jgi:hypothetical protein
MNLLLFHSVLGCFFDEISSRVRTIAAVGSMFRRARVDSCPVQNLHRRSARMVTRLFENGRRPRRRYIARGSTGNPGIAMALRTALRTAWATA